MSRAWKQKMFLILIRNILQKIQLQYKLYTYTTTKGPGKRGHIVADTLLPTQMFPRLPARATFVADTNFVSETQKMFLILIRNILCPQQMFPSLRSMETQHSFCVPRVCAPKKHHEKQCVRYNVSSFARALIQHFTTCEIYRYLRLRPRSLRQTQTHSDFIPWFGLPLATIPQKKHCFVV